MQKPTFSLTIVLVMVLFFVKINIPGQSPVRLNLPKHTIKPSDKPGTVIYTKLTNTTGHSILLHPLLTPMHATESMSIIQGILSQLKPNGYADIDNVCLQLIQIVGHYVKSPNKESFFSNLRDDNNDLLIRREYSFIGSAFSLPDWHCGDFCKEAIYLLEATKFFADSDFILQNCKIHTAMQVKLLNGDTVFVDMAAGTPVFMVANRAKRCGYASLSDILNDTGLITKKSQYYYLNDKGDSANISPLRSIDSYKPVFKLQWRSYNYNASNYPLANFTGDFILAAGQSIEYIDTLGYIIDTTRQENRTRIDADMQKAAYFGVAGKINMDASYLDSALYYLYKPYSEILNIPISEASALFNNGKILLYSSAGNWSPGYLPNQSVLYSSIPASPDTIYYGVQTSAPLLITGSKYIVNGVVTDSFNVAIYGDAVFSAAPKITDRQFNYANGVGIFRQIPPNTIVNQKLLYNYNILNFYAGGTMFLSSDSGILIESSPDAIK